MRRRLTLGRLIRWCVKAVIWFVVISVVWVGLYRFVPPPVTVTMLTNALDGWADAWVGTARATVSIVLDLRLIPKSASPRHCNRPSMLPSYRSVPRADERVTSSIGPGRRPGSRVCRRECGASLPSMVQLGHRRANQEFQVLHLHHRLLSHHLYLISSLLPRIRLLWFLRRRRRHQVRIYIFLSSDAQSFSSQTVQGHPLAHQSRSTPSP